MSGLSGRLRTALASNAAVPTMWPAAIVVIAGIGIGAGVTAALGYGDVAIAAGLVAALAGVAGALLPAALTTQVALPAGVAVALGPALARAGEARPVVAGIVAVVVFTLTALIQQDQPTGQLVGALGGMSYVLAVGVGVVRDVPVSDVVVAGLVGFATAAVLITLLHWYVRHRHPDAEAQEIHLPGRLFTRLRSGAVGALREWRTSPWVRLAARRTIVLAPMVAVVEAWRDPTALYALVVAFSVTQPTAADTVNRALARTAGVICAVAITAGIGLVAPDWVVIVFAVAAMAVGLTYLLRSPFLTYLGTSVLTAATGIVSGSDAAVLDRIIATVAGAAVSLLATALIREEEPRAPSS